MVWMDTLFDETFSIISNQCVAQTEFVGIGKVCGRSKNYIAHWGGTTSRDDDFLQWHWGHAENVSLQAYGV